MGFPMVFPLKPPFSYGFPMVSLWFSYGFPTCFLVKSPSSQLVCFFPLKPTANSTVPRSQRRHHRGREQRGRRPGRFLWEITIFHGKIHYFDWAIFNSYVKLPEGSHGVSNSMSLDWFSRENLNRKPMGFFTIKKKWAFRFQFSHHPILWQWR